MATTVDPFLDNTVEDPSQRAPLVLGGLDYDGVTENVTSIWEAKSPPKTISPAKVNRRVIQRFTE